MSKPPDLHDALVALELVYEAQQIARRYAETAGPTGLPPNGGAMRQVRRVLGTAGWHHVLTEADREANKREGIG